MSTRQLRKLQMLDAAGAAAAGAAEGSSSDELPETVRPKQRRKRTHKKVFEHAEDDGSAEDDGAASPSTAGHAREPKLPPSRSEKTPQDREKKKKSAAKGGAAAGRSRAKGANLDDAAFEATLQQYAEEHLGGDAAAAAAAADDDEDTEGLLPSVADLFAADRDALDPRTERMRSFGAGSVESLKPKHPQCPKFKPSPMGSPDPNTWPPFDPLGMRLIPVDAAKTKGTNLAGTTLYNADVSDSHFQAGSKALHGAAASGDIHVLVDVWHKYPYHLPTLVQLHRTFATMGDVGEAQRCLDMALYTVGTVLSPMLGKASTAAMLLASPGATLILETLKLGVHNALRKGCARTALEVLKVSFAADPQDTQRLLIIGDYIAIRASQWSWLAAVVASARTSAGLPISAMPSWTFNAALGCKMLRDAAAAAVSAGKKKQKKQVDTLEMVAEVEEMTQDSGAQALRRAVLRFPTAAVAIADRAGHKLDGHPWSAFTDAPLTALTRGVVESRVLRHITAVEAERCADLWKMPNAIEFMAAAVAGIAADFAANPEAVVAEQQREVALFAPLETFEPVLGQYIAVTPDEALGNFTGPAIPRELLEAGPTEEEMRRDHDERVMAHLDDDQRLMLERFEAAFGPLPADVPADQRLHIYEDMLGERVQQLGQDQNAVALFLRTLLPWNTPRQMALQRAIQQAGREDPAVARRRAERQRAEDNDVEFVTYSSDDDEAAAQR